MAVPVKTEAVRRDRGQAGAVPAAASTTEAADGTAQPRGQIVSEAVRTSERNTATLDGAPPRGEAAAETSRRRLAAAVAALREMDPASPEAARDAALLAIGDAARAQDAFLHAAAHDLRNPLAAVRGQAQLLRRRLGRLGTPAFDPARFDDGLAGIDAAVERAVGLIDGLLDAGWDGADKKR